MEAGYAALGRAISFDGRGMGLSDRLRDRRLPPIEERMDDLTAVLDAAGAERALVVAGADGGPLSCLFAATYPERTLGLALLKTAPRIAWAPGPWGMRRDEFDRELEAMEAGWGTPEYAEEHAPWPMEGMTREETVEWWLEWMRLSAAPGDAVALWRMFYEPTSATCSAPSGCRPSSSPAEATWKARRRLSPASSPAHGCRRFRAPHRR